jgi:opacity protein-like surface antigen
MKRILIASAVAFAAGGQALAADLPPPMAPPPRAPAMYVPVVPLYNWTGFYLGGNLGFGLTGGSFNSSIPGTSVSQTTSTSFLGGGQVGVNYEFGGGVVIGAEAMFDWLPNTKNTFNLNTTATGANVGSATINNRWLTTATASSAMPGIAYCCTPRAVAPGSAPAILAASSQPPERQCQRQVRATMRAGRLVSASNGRSLAIGRRGLSTTISV